MSLEGTSEQTIEGDEGVSSVKVAGSEEEP